MTLSTPSSATHPPQWLLSETRLIFFLIFILLPLFDMASGVLIVRNIIPEGGLASPSLLGRMAVMAMLLYVCFRRKLNIAILAVVALYLLPVEFYSGFLHQEPRAVIFGLVSSYKILYLVVECMVLTALLSTRAQAESFGFYLKCNLILISSSLIFAQITGLGNSTYGYGFGTKGFFASGNAIGAYIGICALLLFSLKQYKVYTHVNQAWFLIFAISTALIGSKTAMLFSALQLLVMMWYSRFRLVWVALFVTILLFLLPKLIDVFSVVFDIVVKRYQNADSIITFLGSGRVGYVEGAFEVFNPQEHHILRMIFGSGAYLSYQDPRFAIQYDTLETDIFDVLFMYGIIGVMMYVGLLLTILYKLVRYPLMVLGLLLLALHSILAGHVLFNGQTSACLAMFIAMASYLHKTRSRTIVEVNDKFCCKTT